MTTDPLETVLEVCLQQIRSGVSLDEALTRYPQWADELRPRLEAVLAAEALRASLQVPRAAQMRSRARLLAEAQTAAQTRWPLFALIPLRRASATLALVMGVILASFGTVVASAQSLPGDLLYPLKLTAENVRLRLTTNPAQQRELELAFDHTRVQEVRALLQLGRRVRVKFAGALTQYASDKWLVAGLRVTIPVEVLALGGTRPGFYVDIEGGLQSDGTVLVEKLNIREVEFSGELSSFAQDHWIVDEVNVGVTPGTIVPGSPLIGNSVHVRAALLADGTLQAITLEVIGSASPITSPTGTSTVETLEPTRASELTHAPAPTETQASTATSRAPAPTRTPAPSETRAPTETHKPEATRRPELTKTPAPPTDTPVPGTTSTPTRTVEPTHPALPTQAPSPTRTPEATHITEPTRTPLPPTSTHEPARTPTQPEPTHTSPPTNTPEATHTPEPTMTPSPTPF